MCSASRKAYSSRYFGGGGGEGKGRRTEASAESEIRWQYKYHLQHALSRKLFTMLQSRWLTNDVTSTCYDTDNNTGRDVCSSPELRYEQECIHTLSLSCSPAVGPPKYTKAKDQLVSQAPSDTTGGTPQEGCKRKRRQPNPDLFPHDM